MFGLCCGACAKAGAAVVRATAKVDANIHGATWYGVVADRATVNITGSQIHDIGDDDPASGCQGQAAGRSGLRHHQAPERRRGRIEAVPTDQTKAAAVVVVDLDAAGIGADHLHSSPDYFPIPVSTRRDTPRDLLQPFELLQSLERT